MTETPTKIQTQAGDDVPPTDPLRVKPHAGPHYHTVLAALHTLLRTRTYMEIGVETGATLALATCPSLAVDVEYRLNRDVMANKPACLMYRMTSDRFFAENKPARLFGRPVDFAFLDGMHLFEFLLRDFIGAEAACATDSVIALHDCLPFDVFMTRRDRGDPVISSQTATPYLWTGDVWKTVLALRRYRPDLLIQAYDAAPTGLVLVSNLAPESAVLRDNYARIVAEFMPVTLREYGLARYLAELPVLPTAKLIGARAVAEIFPGRDWGLPGGTPGGTPGGSTGGVSG